MADEVNQFAFEGGDTEPETAKVIKARNEALQALKDKNTETQQKAVEAQQEAYANQIQAEREVAIDMPDLTTGAPVQDPKPEE